MSGFDDLPIDDVLAFPLFKRFVHAAQTRQHFNLTERQMETLMSRFLATQPRDAGLLMGWYIMHRSRVLRALRSQGVGIRATRYPKPHRFQLHQAGFARLTELEQKVARSQARKARSGRSSLTS